MRRTIRVIAYLFSAADIMHETDTWVVGAVLESRSGSTIDIKIWGFADGDLGKATATWQELSTYNIFKKLAKIGENEMIMVGQA